jgi:hypothetical protein
MTAERTKTTPNHHAALNSLPAEILGKVIADLDLPSALSLALVSPSFTPSVDPKIWQIINLSAHNPERFFTPLGPSDDPKDVRGIASHKETIRRMVKGIMKAGTDGGGDMLSA